MILLKIMLVLAGTFALYWQIRIKQVMSLVITIGMVTGMLIVLLLPGFLQTSGFIIYLASVAMVPIYSLTVKGKDVLARIIMVLISGGIFTYWLWVLSHWHGNEILVILLIPIAGLAWILGKARLKNELGFLILLVADGLAILVEHLLKSI